MKNLTLDEYRAEIDEIDKQIALLFQKRMDISKNIAKLKKDQSIPILNKDREYTVIQNVKKHVRSDLHFYIKELYTLIMYMSREYQI